MPDRPRLHPRFRGELIAFDARKSLNGAPVVTTLGYKVSGFRMMGNQLHGVVCNQISQWNLDGTFPIAGPAARILDLRIGVPEKTTFLTRVSDWLETFFMGSDRRIA